MYYQGKDVPQDYTEAMRWFAEPRQHVAGAFR